MWRFRTPRLTGSLALTAVLVLSACSGGGDDDPTTTTTTTQPAVTGTATLGPITVERAGTAGELSAADAQAVLAALDAYLDQAVFTPIATGEVPTGLVSLFTPAAGTAANASADLVDTGLPRPTGDAHVTIEPVALTALADVSGQITLVSAALTLHLEVPTAEGTMVIDRRGELVYEPIEGQWQIASFSLTVDRQIPDPPTTTTTKAKK